jgi:hypothetical protein
MRGSRARVLSDHAASRKPLTSAARLKGVRVLPVAVLILAFDANAQAQDSRTSSPVSIEHIQRWLLERPLQIPPVTASEPAFRIDVDAEWPRETPLDVARKELSTTSRANRPTIPTPSGAVPLVQIDVMPALQQAIHRMRDIRREHAQRNARRLVADDLAQFCADHDCSQVEQPQREGVFVR